MSASHTSEQTMPSPLGHATQMGIIGFWIGVSIAIAARALLNFKSDWDGTLAVAAGLALYATLFVLGLRHTADGDSARQTGQILLTALREVLAIFLCLLMIMAAVIWLGQALGAAEDPALSMWSLKPISIVWIDGKLVISRVVLVGILATVLFLLTFVIAWGGAQFMKLLNLAVTQRAAAAHPSDTPFGTFAQAMLRTIRRGRN